MSQTCPSDELKASAEISAAETGGEVRSVASSNLVRSILVFSVAGVLLYGAATLASDYRTVVGSLLRFPLAALGIVLGLVAVGWLIRGWRFHYYLSATGTDVPLGYAISAFLAGFALTGTPGKAGEAVKGVFLKQDYGVPMTRVVGILMVERLMDLWAILLLGSFSLLLFRDWWGLFLICAAVVVLGGVFLCMESLYRPVLERLSKVRFMSWVCTKVLSALLAGRELMTPRIFLVGLVVSSVAWALESVSLYLVLRGFDLSATVLQANFVYCFSQIVGALSMLPGGIGSAEAGMIGLLSVLGISYGAGLPAVILFRICTLWAAVMVGVVFMAYMLAKGARDPNRLPSSRA